MMMTTILICAIGVAQPDCSTETAQTVIQGPKANDLAQCGFLGQAYLANTAFADDIDGEHYLKILCTVGDSRQANAEPRIGQPAKSAGDVGAAHITETATAEAKRQAPGIYRVGIGTSPR